LQEVKAHQSLKGFKCDVIRVFCCVFIEQYINGRVVEPIKHDILGPSSQACCEVTELILIDMAVPATKSYLISEFYAFTQLPDWSNELAFSMTYESSIVVLQRHLSVVAWVRARPNQQIGRTG
jgi:hypothetical protein